MRSSNPVLEKYNSNRDNFYTWSSFESTGWYFTYVKKCAFENGHQWTTTRMNENTVSRNLSLCVGLHRLFCPPSRFPHMEMVFLFPIGSSFQRPTRWTRDIFLKTWLWREQKGLQVDVNPTDVLSSAGERYGQRGKCPIDFDLLWCHNAHTRAAERLYDRNMFFALLVFIYLTCRCLMRCNATNSTYKSTVEKMNFEKLQFKFQCDILCSETEQSKTP